MKKFFEKLFFGAMWMFGFAAMYILVALFRGLF